MRSKRGEGPLSTGPRIQVPKVQVSQELVPKTGVPSLLVPGGLPPSPPPPQLISSGPEHSVCGKELWVDALLRGLWSED